MEKWTTENIPGQSGRTALITGANSGIGFEAAKVLAEKGAQVILAVRNDQKGQTAKAAILNAVPGASVDVEILDLASLQSVDNFSKVVLAKYDQLDLLINNAGIMIPPYSKTEDGFESQMGTNHLGHFALTAKLFPLLEKTKGSRIVNVSSNAHKMGKIDFDDLHWEKRKYVPWKAYGDTKIANLYFTFELTKRLMAKESHIMVTAAHPGWSATGLQKSLGLKIANALMAQSQFMGSLPTLMAATEETARSGDYFGPSGPAEWRGYPKRVFSNELSHNEEIAARLWRVSEELTGQKFKL